MDAAAGAQSLGASELSVGLRNVRVTVPTAVRKGDPAHLYCEYELEDNERLYSIKWYKGKREFYRYTPQVHPSVQVFSTVSGIDVERFTQRYTLCDPR
uniref:Ig-like domain-containing protein n=1 Tax=Anopheles dirus TaxID=7168 RepID=A0A182NAW5_9DIPT